MNNQQKDKKKYHCAPSTAVQKFQTLSFTEKRRQLCMRGLLEAGFSRITML